MGELLHKDSPMCTKSELDLFAMPGTQTAIDSSYLQELKSINPIGMGGPMEFVMEGSSDEYSDLHSLTLYTKFKVTREGGANLHPNDIVALEQNTLHSMFSQIDITLGDTVISHSDQMHHYRAYIDDVLSFGSDAHRTRLRAGGMKLPPPDDQGVYEQVGTSEYRLKNKVPPAAATLELMGPLHVDIANQEKLMLSATNMRVKLTPNKKDFYLKVGADKPATANVALVPAPKHFIIRLEDVSLWVRKVHVNPAVFLAHAQVLQQHNAIYPMKRVGNENLHDSAGQHVTQQGSSLLGSLTHSFGRRSGQQQCIQREHAILGLQFRAHRSVGSDPI